MVEAYLWFFLRRLNGEDVSSVPDDVVVMHFAVHLAFGWNILTGMRNPKKATDKGAVYFVKYANDPRFKELYIAGFEKRPAFFRDGFGVEKGEPYERYKKSFEVLVALLQPLLMLPPGHEYCDKVAHVLGDLCLRPEFSTKTVVCFLLHCLHAGNKSVGYLVANSMPPATVLEKVDPGLLRSMEGAHERSKLPVTYRPLWAGSKVNPYDVSRVQKTPNGNFSPKHLEFLQRVAFLLRTLMDEQEARDLANAMKDRALEMPVWA